MLFTFHVILKEQLHPILFVFVVCIFAYLIVATAN